MMDKRIAILAAVIACAIAQSSCDDPIIDEALMDVVWVADSMLTPDGRVVRGPDSLLTLIQPNDTTQFDEKFKRFITIQFLEDMQLGATLICNSCGGTYEISEIGLISIFVGGCTEMACAWGLPLPFSLEDVTAYEVNDSTLTLYNDNRSYVVVFSPEL